MIWLIVRCTCSRVTFLELVQWTLLSRVVPFFALRLLLTLYCCCQMNYHSGIALIKLFFVLLIKDWMQESWLSVSCSFRPFGGNMSFSQIKRRNRPQLIMEQRQSWNLKIPINFSKIWILIIKIKIIMETMKWSSDIFIQQKQNKEINGRQQEL